MISNTSMRATSTYNYDHLDQLTGESSQPVTPTMNDPYHLTYNFGFGYDAVGNAQSFRSQGNL
ncbi:MAG: hypothetical protein M3Y56_08895, partial [Armatimonadota bacterium]|nr:hypothetical protein [Armatimonadota bacterium]